MTLAALSFVAPVIAVYFVVIKTADRYEPEPLWILLATFLWGSVVATFAALVLNQMGMGVLTLGLGMPATHQLVEWSTASIVAPLVEETTKGVGLLLLWLVSAVWIQEIDGPLDGAIYGGMIGLGFTLTEDVIYVSSAGLEQGSEGFMLTFVMRTVMSGLGHASFTAMTGLGIGIAVESRRPLLVLLAPVFGWGCAVGLHALHNALATFFYFDGTGVMLKFVIFWLLDALFFVLVLVLALRDRRIVARELGSEVGRVLTPGEYRRTVSAWMLVPGWNYLSLRSTHHGYRLAREKQLLLIKLAFAKHRRQRGWARLATRRVGVYERRLAEMASAGVYFD